MESKPLRDDDDEEDHFTKRCNLPFLAPSKRGKEGEGGRAAVSDEILRRRWQKFFRLSGQNSDNGSRDSDRRYYSTERERERERERIH